ncbi:RNA polymerase [Rhodococcus sp. 05-340-1]|nr:RNA polymerase [Rhodococcus sp. 05-340-2]OZD85037.1 RNA polymerase [Rhodococcus sp. 05-340-1]OZE95839.1 RNA polymerase [Rhodococcus sp. 15-2388-1-1a]OZF32876.1 RNA polymerase [Rhodococcus sp. 14-2483-1-2]
MNVRGSTDVSTVMSIGSVIELDFDVAAAYDEHASAMLGFAVNALRDRTLAEDCVQETFFRAWRARSRFEPRRGSLRTWLFAIERNVIVDVQRSLTRMPMPASDRIEDIDRGSGGVTRDTSPDIDERLRIIAALALLSPEHRQVVVAVHLSGSTYAELSESTGVAVRTLRTRTFYALRALRDHLDGKEET